MRYTQERFEAISDTYKILDYINTYRSNARMFNKAKCENIEEAIYKSSRINELWQNLNHLKELNESLLNVLNNHESEDNYLVKEYMELVKKVRLRLISNKDKHIKMIEKKAKDYRLLQEINDDFKEIYNEYLEI